MTKMTKKLLRYPNLIIGIFCSLLLSSPLSLWGSNSYSVGNEVSLMIPKEGGLWSLVNKEGVLLGEGPGFQLFDGRSGEVLNLQLLRVVDRPSQSTVFHYGVEDKNEIGVRIELTKMDAGGVNLALRIDNRTDEQLWLIPALKLTLVDNKYKWFDGYEVRSRRGQRQQIAGTLPLVAVYSEGTGFAFGLNATELVSQFGSSLAVIENKPVLKFESQMVLDPWSYRVRNMVLFSFKPEFGYRNAIGVYYDMFPSVFEMAEGIDPEVAGPSLGGFWWRTNNTRYLGSEGFNEKTSDLLRWMGGGWDWCYMGYGYRPGDWLMTEELSGDWVVETKEGKKAIREIIGMSASEYNYRHHLAAYERADYFKVAQMMYIIPNYVEIELAMNKYPDSIYYDNQGRFRSSGPPWVTSYDESVQVYPYGNSFGDYTLAAIEQRVRDSNIRGFAFDCIDRANYNYFGPGVERSPGRGFDADRGVFANSEIAHALFGRAVHRLERDGYRMALSGNVRGSTGSYLSCFAMDAAIIEHSPWDDRPRAHAARNLMGRKSITFWQGYQRLPDLESKSEEELIQMAQTLADFSVLKCLELGIYPNPRLVIGSPMMIYFSRVFNDLFRNYGWNPVPATLGKKDLWITRYGQAEGGVVSVGNPTINDFEGQLEFVANYFNASEIIMLDYEGKDVVQNRLGNGRSLIDARVPAGKPRLYQAGLQLRQPVSAVVSAVRPQGLGRPVIDRFTFESGQGEEIVACVVDLPGHLIDSIHVDGRLAKHVTDTEGKHTFRLKLQTGTEVMVRYLPLVGISNPNIVTDAELISSDNQPNLRIYIGEDDDLLHAAAQRVINYLSNFVYSSSNAREMLEIPVNVASPERSGSGWNLYIGSASQLGGVPNVDSTISFPGATVFADKGLIAVTGEDPELLSDAVDLVLDYLVKKYPYYGYFQISSGGVRADGSLLQPSLFQEITGLDYLPWERK